MASGERHLNLSYRELEKLCSEQESLLQSLLDQLQAAEDERDKAMHGLDLLTQASRRRGCCEHESNGHSH